MSQNLALLNYGEIRVTPDERYSVFDVVRVVGGKKNPRQAWDGLVETFPEVVQKVDSFKFPGKGQQLTPVTNKEGLLHIIGLLPGAVGRTYREDAAKLMLSKIEGRSDEVVGSSDNLALPPAPREISEAIALNKLLVELGLQVKNADGNPSYLPTDAGAPYSKVVLQEGNGSNKTCQQLRWYPQVIEKLA